MAVWNSALEFGAQPVAVHYSVGVRVRGRRRIRLRIRIMVTIRVMLARIKVAVSGPEAGSAVGTMLQ